MTRIDFSTYFRAQGAAMAETIIVFPIMMFVGLGIVHLGLIYQAKSNLEYAAFMSARQSASTFMGSLTDDDDPDAYGGLNELKYTIRCRMAAYDPLPEGVVCDGNDLPVAELDKVRVQFIRPTAGTFRAWGEIAAGVPCAAVAVGCYIPNDNLINMDPTDTRSDPDDDSGLGPLINIQDSNIMTISVRYLIDTGVPFINGFFIGESGTTNMEDLAPDTFVSDPFGRSKNRPGVWVTAESTMLMQTSATISAENLCAIGDYC